MNSFCLVSGCFCHTFGSSSGGCSQKNIHTLIHKIVDHGINSCNSYNNGIAIGDSAIGNNGIAVGNNSTANKIGSASIGYKSKVDGEYANLFGSNCFNYNPNTTVIGSVILDTNTGDVLKRTQLYLIPEGSELANECYPNAVSGRNACLGFAVFDSDNNIIQKGTRKLSDLFIDNTQSSDPFKPSTIPSNN